jgi:hypothetical protein
MQDSHQKLVQGKQKRSAHPAIGGLTRDLPAFVCLFLNLRFIPCIIPKEFCAAHPLWFQFPLLS